MGALSSSSSKTQVSTIPAIDKGLGKIDDGASRGSYASGSSSRAKTVNKRAAPEESAVPGFPHTNAIKKAKTEHRKALKPPPGVEEKVVAIPNRSQKEQAGNGLVQPAKPQTYGRKGNRQNGTQAANASKGKGKGKQETTAKVEIIALDEDTDEDEDSKEVHQQAMAMKGTKADREINDVFSASSKVNSVVQQRHSPEKPAMASQAESIESASGTGEVRSPIVTISTNILPAPPPLEGDSSMGHTGTSKDQHWETTGFAIVPTGTGAGQSERCRSRSVSPTKSKPAPRFALSPSGPGPQSHIAYSNGPQTSRSASRSPSPDLQLEVEPVPDYTVGRPDWIDDPPQIDQDDLRLFRQIPHHLRMPFVALADELDAMNEPHLNLNLTMAYLDFRGWSNQGLPAQSDGPNVDLDARHVSAAQMVWRAFRSGQILRAEAEAKTSAGRQDNEQETDAVQHPEPSRGSDTAQEVQNQTAPSSNHVNSTSKVPPVSTTNGQPEVHSLPDTPKNRPPVEIGESPEFVVQPAPPKNVERIGRFESPEGERKHVEADVIESPEEGRRGFRGQSINSDVEFVR